MKIRRSCQLSGFSCQLLCAVVLLGAATALSAWQNTAEVKIITLDPAHFHAALVQREMLPGVSKHVAVYAPLGPDLLEHLARIERFNSRPVNPTSWELDVHCTPNSLQAMLAQKPGNVVVISGRNRGKIEKITASVDAGLNVLADKPWIIHARDLPALEAAIDTAQRKRVVVYDIMTERYEITTILQRELVNDPAVFGTIVPGSEREPAVSMESVHHIMKKVDGVPTIRPPFFFDIEEQGQAIADVGTHLVDLAQWTLFPGQAIHYRQDVQVLGAKRWATPITRAEYQAVTGQKDFAPELRPYVHGDRFDYLENGEVRYQIRGVHVKLDALWRYESPGGTDLHHAIYRGTKATIEVRQGAQEKYRPELYVVPVASHDAVVAALKQHVDRLQAKYPGVALVSSGTEWHVTIPDKYRITHEEHFAQVFSQFLKYMRAPDSMPEWERLNTIAKYYITTKGVELSEQQAARR